MSQPPSPTSTPPKAPASPLGSKPTLNESISESAEVTDKIARPSIPFPGADASKDDRRTSIQFHPGVDTAVRTTKPKIPPSKPGKRMSSPPPPSTYESRVSFNTFDNKDVTDISFTLSSRHKNFVETRRSRTFLCGTDQNDYSEFALEWLIEELAEDGDEVVCLRVVDKDSKIASEPSVQQGLYKEEARSLLQSVEKKNEDGKAIKFILEFAVGKVPDTIQRMIQIYAPTSLIVGTRGRSLGGITGLLPGSVSKYCLQNSPVPVVVVRPEDKRAKKKAKRLADPTRKGYSSILDNATASGSGDFHALAKEAPGEADGEEALAVAKAIGLDEGALGKWMGFENEGEGAPLVRMTSTAKSDVGTEDTPSPYGPLAIDDAELEEVPDQLEALGSPRISAADDELEKSEPVVEMEKLNLAE